MTIIGIAGGTGSGKTTVVRKIVEALPPNYVAVVPQDSYYNDTTHMTDEERKAINFDHTDAFDWRLLIKQIGELKEGRAIEQPTYSYILSNRLPETVHVEPKPVIIVEGIMALVRKSYLKGNLKVGFEISGSDAVVHTESADSAVSEEELILGTVQLIPQSIKKWISISDEVYDLRGEAFLRYIYDELAYRIAKKCADELIAKIEACGTVSTATCVGVPVVTAASVTQGTIASAMALLSDEANNPVVMMNKATWAQFKAVQYAGNFNADPFENLPVVFNNTITAFSVATTGDTYAIVGDLGEGALANFPNGDEIEFKFDDKGQMKKDLIDVLGRRYVALAPVAPNAFVKIQK